MSIYSKRYLDSFPPRLAAFQASFTWSEAPVGLLPRVQRSA
jgi:hypothetical protein